MYAFPQGQHATVIGKVTSSGKAVVRMKNIYGGYRVINMLNGDQLPRIC
jgi:hydrogenase expression/formation protein HypE